MCPLGGQCVVYTRVITVIEARLHRVSFETCSPQTPDPIMGLPFYLALKRAASDLPYFSGVISRLFK